MKSFARLVPLLLLPFVATMASSTTPEVPGTDAVAIAKGAGYQHALWVKSLEEFRGAERRFQMRGTARGSTTSWRSCFP